MRWAWGPGERTRSDPLFRQAPTVPISRNQLREGRLYSLLYK